MNFYATRAVAEWTKMVPTKFPQANMTLTRPPTMTDEECISLDVHVSHSGDEMVSRWRATWRERLAILFGRPVWLRVIGARHPPVTIEVADPFKVDIHA